MDRRLAALALALAAACRPAPTSTAPRVLARGTLGYAVAIDGQRLVTIELELAFALVVRDLASGRVERQVSLGPPERDLPALAVADGVAWVGGADAAVRAIDLADGTTRARWPIGAAVTALAVAAPDLLVVGDAAGAVCLRRRTDGALLQCVAMAPGPIRGLDLDGDVVTATTATGRRGLRLPTLATTRPRPTRLEVVDHVVRVDGRDRLRFAGAARAAALGTDGVVAAVGWVMRLDDPSVIIVGPTTPPAGRRATD
ncbi:MAG: hypothetical protein R3B06_05880 [Kofleriaceae bacterium]